MQIREIMTENREIISEDATIFDAAAKMKQLNVGVLPVGYDSNLSGIVTDRDIVVRAIAENRNPAQTLVKEVMSRELFTCRQNDDVADCSKKMEERQIRRMVVTEESGRPVGIISVGDISTKSGRELGGEVISRISEPSRPNR